MSRMDLGENSALRYHGWDVFRSSSRDHMIPMTGPGRKLQRIKIAEALPVEGVFEGVALSLEERAVRESARVEAGRSVSGAFDEPLGIMQYLHFGISNANAGLVLGEPTDSDTVIGVAPYDGWMREIMLDGSLSGATLPAVAIRTSAGQTWFRSFEDGLNPNTSTFLAPDYGRLNYAVAADRRVTLRGGKVPVFAGDEIIISMRDVNNTGANTLVVSGYIGIEAVVLARTGRAASSSAFAAFAAEANRAAAESASLQGRLALEQEKTRRVLETERLRTERAREEAAARERLRLLQPAGRSPSTSPDEILRKLQTRSAPPPPPRRFLEAPPVTATGAGQTFVSAWNPANGTIGYTIPDPPKGGKVNVFNGRYTIWSASGQNLGEGNVTPVRTDSEIPPEARVSRNLGGRPPSGLFPASGPGSFQPAVGEQSLL